MLARLKISRSKPNLLFGLKNGIYFTVSPANTAESGFIMLACQPDHQVSNSSVLLRNVIT